MFLYGFNLGLDCRCSWVGSTGSCGCWCHTANLLRPIYRLVRDHATSAFRSTLDLWIANTDLRFHHAYQRGRGCDRPRWCKPATSRVSIHLAAPHSSSWPILLYLRAAHMLVHLARPSRRFSHVAVSEQSSFGSRTQSSGVYAKVVMSSRLSQKQPSTEEVVLGTLQHHQTFTRSPSLVHHTSSPYTHHSFLWSLVLLPYPITNAYVPGFSMFATRPFSALFCSGVTATLTLLDLVCTVMSQLNRCKAARGVHPTLSRTTTTLTQLTMTQSLRTMSRLCGLMRAGYECYADIQQLNHSYAKTRSHDEYYEYHHGGQAGAVAR